MIEKFLRRKFKFKEIGWHEIGERFTRYAIFKSSWLNIYLHQLYAPAWHPQCHDHPWGFVAILLRSGYLERVHVNNVECISLKPLTKDVRRRAGTILWRPATFAHNVITPYGVSWSLIFAGPKSREWGFKPCDNPAAASKPYQEYILEHS